MPKVIMGMSLEDKLKREELIERYGHLLTVAAVERIIGAKHYNTAQKFLKGLRSYNINGHDKYDLDDVLARLIESRKETA